MSSLPILGCILSFCFDFSFLFSSCSRNQIQSANYSTMPDPEADMAVQTVPSNAVWIQTLHATSTPSIRLHLEGLSL